METGDDIIAYSIQLHVHVPKSWNHLNILLWHRMTIRDDIIANNIQTAKCWNCTCTYYYISILH